jgi:hypothetical protein
MKSGGGTLLTLAGFFALMSLFAAAPIPRCRKSIDSR